MAASEKLNLLFYWEFLKVALVRIHIGFAFWFLTRNLNWEYHKFLEFQTLSEMSIKEIGMIYAELMTTLRIFKGTVNMKKAEAVVRKCSVKKVFLEILLNSQENTCATVSFLQP